MALVGRVNRARRAARKYYKPGYSTGLLPPPSDLGSGATCAAVQPQASVLPALGRGAGLQRDFSTLPTEPLALCAR